MNDYRINSLKKYIEEHFTEEISVDDLADKAGYSKYHLNRIFQENTGKSIYQYIKERRLYEAADLLLINEQPIVEIALLVGYSSQQAFSQAFKKEFEMTPGEYRNKMRFTQVHGRRPVQIKSVYGKLYTITGYREVMAA